MGALDADHFGMINIGRQTLMVHDDVVSMCVARRGVEEITDQCAATIASFWQSPGNCGKAFASLASTGYVALEELLDDIHYSYVHETGDLDDKLMLDMLATWAIDVCRPVAGELRESAE